MRELLLGVDIGTGGCKATLIDTDGVFVGDGYTEYPSHHPHFGWFEQKAKDWFPAMVNSLRIAAEKGGVSPSQVVGVCIDASAHNTVLMGKDGSVLRDVIMWPDQRSTKEVAFLKEHYLEDCQKITFQTPSPTWSLPQMMWIRDNEPEVYSKVDRIMFIDDYVRYQLTGEWATEHIQAQGSMLFDNNKWGWSEEMCKLCDMPMSALPPILKPTDIAGRVTKEAAALTGLKEGTPVITGASDTALESYSVGGLTPGDCVLKMATAGVIFIFREDGTPYKDTFMYSHVVDGMWYCSRGTSSAAQSLRWYRDTFCQEEIKLEQAGGMDTYQLLDKEAELVPPGSDGLFFHPYLAGERAPYWDAKLRGSFVGFSSMHGRGHFNRALMEGVTFSLRQCFSIMEDFGPIDEIRFLGGGAKSPLWRSILANVFNRRILKFKRDDSSLGGAMLAGVGIGAFSSHQDAVAKAAVVDCVTEPDPEIVAKYDKIFPLYEEIHDDLVGTYHKYEVE